MKKPPIEIIARYIKVIAWLLLLPSILVSILLIEAVFDSHSHHSCTTSVTVAATNLEVGVIMTSNNIAYKSMLKSTLPSSDYVCSSDGVVLFGHKIVKAVEYGKPINWRNTDIVLTNQVPKEYLEGTK